MGNCDVPPNIAYKHHKICYCHLSPTSISMVSLKMENKVQN